MFIDTRQRPAIVPIALPALLLVLLSAFSTPVAIAADPDLQRIELQRNGAQGDRVDVTFGIPFPPGVLTDARRVRILDEHDNEIPAHVSETLRWHFKDRSIRAVRVQARVDLRGDRGRLRFAVDQPRQGRDLPGWPYHEGLVDGAEGLRVPGVLATLHPAWLSQSLIAGPQAPASTASAAYDAYVARQFEWARTLPVENGSAWLFDRTSTLFKHYVRTGDAQVLAAAIVSYRFYMSHLVRSRGAGGHRCVGGWRFGNVDPCDVKYVYIEPIMLALALAGDDSQHDAPLVADMAQLWDSGGWSGIRGPYLQASQDFTERQAGLGLVALVNAFELTGTRRYLDSVERRLGWLHDHQRDNPDGLGDEGCWRHSWQMHEGERYQPDSDIRGCSPWMSENIIDGLWQAWQVTGDARIPPMITGFGRWLENHGWIGESTFQTAGHDWRDPCSGPNGQIAWYFGSSQVALERLIELQNSEGWYSDAHTVQLALPVAAARYFETDPEQARALEWRLARIEHSYANQCAASAHTARRFNWNNRGSGVVQWLKQNFPEPEAPAPD